MPKTKAPAPRPLKLARTLTTPYDAAENLTSKARMEALLEAALEDGHPKVIAAALGTLARAQGMAKIAKDTGLNPKLSTGRCRVRGIQSWTLLSRWYVPWGFSFTRALRPDWKSPEVEYPPPPVLLPRAVPASLGASAPSSFASEPGRADRLR